MIRATLPRNCGEACLMAAALVAAGSLARAAPPAGHDAATPLPPGAAVTHDRRPIRERFRDLDAYLAHLQKRSHLDGPWYREIRPGLYEYVTSLRLEEPAAPKTYTREELMRKYGFTR